MRTDPFLDGDRMNETHVTLQGNLGGDVRFHDTAKGAVASFRVGTTPRWPDRTTGAWVDGDTTWYTVTAWRALARNCAASLHKGDPVVVHGRLTGREWSNAQGSGTTLEVDATFVGHDLNRGTGTFARTGPGPALAPDPAAAGAASAEEEVVPQGAAA
ncbi:single-stranded DNA-binding protein [Nocardioides anomalus]|uniref:Single-stranded DNA-binding protein n=1 Tax=Nocardioides anomalus TaxID=2712223 RepID=A0A6G6WAG2_9ACTN|nr:single-stranded DNA-binding protein [Nocardioides anomalus]QIG42133.1 single-stranded DNA-binding protein [Nocardioides anomalus]